MEYKSPLLIRTAVCWCTVTVTVSVVDCKSKKARLYCGLLNKPFCLNPRLSLHQVLTKPFVMFEALCQPHSNESAIALVNVNRPF